MVFLKKGDNKKNYTISLLKKDKIIINPLMVVRYGIVCSKKKISLRFLNPSMLLATFEK